MTNKIDASLDNLERDHTMTNKQYSAELFKLPLPTLERTAARADANGIGPKDDFYKSLTIIKMVIDHRKIDAEVKEARARGEF